jgi:hypothetical protein
MSIHAGSLEDYTERFRRRAPESLDLFSAETDEEFEKAFDTLIERAVAGLERDKRNFDGLSEDGLSSVFALALSMPGLTVTREANSNGHVDITIEADHCVPMRKKLGEAKIYSGPAYHVKGLQQLLGRYTTGREGRGLLIIYVKKRDIAGLIKNLRETLDADLPLQQKGATEDHAMKWSFISVHGHSCGEDLEVSHIGCNLFVE